MIDRFSLSVAIRHLLYYKGQTLLTMGVVAVSVTLIIFLGALIGGLQKRLISSVTGAIPHVVVRQPEREPVAAWEVASAGQPLYLGERVKLQQQKRKIEPLADVGAAIARVQRQHPRGIAGGGRTGVCQPQ